MQDEGDNTTQYVILAENQRKKAALAAAKFKVAALIAENRKLLEERETTREEQYVASEYLRKKLLSSNEKIAEFEKTMASKQEEFDRALFTEREKSERALATLTEEWKAKEKSLKLSIAAHEKELASIKHFKEAKNEIESHMERLQEEAEESRAQNDLLTAELERKFIEQHTKLKKDYEHRLEELKRAAEEDIDEKLDASAKRILQQNRRMAEELRMHVRETDVLNKKVRSLEASNKKLVREIEIKRQMEKEYAKRGSKQSREMSSTMSKVEDLQKSLNTVMKEYEEERGQLTDEKRRIAVDAETEKMYLKKQVGIRTRELKKLRQLAQTVLDQRCEMEQFFIDSLQLCKEEIRKERGASRGGSSSKSLPQIRTASAGGYGKPSTAREGPLDIRDLTWEERERVLRTLFQKMNTPQQLQKHTSSAMNEPRIDVRISSAPSLPAHTFDRSSLDQPAILLPKDNHGPLALGPLGVQYPDSQPITSGLLRPQLV